MATHRLQDALLRAAEAPLQGVFYPLGFRLEIETNDARVLEAAKSAYGIFHPDAPPHPPLRMRLLRAPGSAAEPPWPAPAYRAWCELFSVVCGPDNFLSANLGSHRAMGFFSTAMLDDTEFFFWTFLDCATQMLLSSRYTTPVHASCVVRNGRGVLLCAPAGGGKTSLAYHCVRHGWALLADDVVNLLRDRPELDQDLHRVSSGSNNARAAYSLTEIRGNPSRLHFPVSARQLFPELYSVDIGVRRDGAEFLAVDTTGRFPGQLATRAHAVAVVFLDRQAGPAGQTGLSRVSATDTHRLLFEDRPLAHEEQIMAEFSRSIERLAQGGAYRLRYSALEEAREQLEAISARVTASDPQ